MCLTSPVNAFNLSKIRKIFLYLISSVPDPDPNPRVFCLPDPDPDPLVRGMDPDPDPDPALDPDPSITCKNNKKNLESLLCDSF